MIEFVGTLPEHVEVTMGRADVPFVVENLGRLTIAGYADVSMHFNKTTRLAQPLILLDGQPAIRPFRYDWATDHTFYTFDRRLHTIVRSDDIARLVFNSASKVLVYDDPAKSALIDLYLHDFADITTAATAGAKCWAKIFDEPIPYDNDVFFDTLQANLPQSVQAA